MRALAWSPDGTRLAGGGGDGLVRLWDAADPDVALHLTIHHFEGGSWCTIDAGGNLRACAGEVWRWLRWRHRDPVSGKSALLPAEYFGALPYVGSTTSTPSR